MHELKINMVRASLNPVVAGVLVGLGLPLAITIIPVLSVDIAPSEPASEVLARRVVTPAIDKVRPPSTVPVVAIGAALPPPPTEVATDDAAEAKQKHLRKAWFRERHGAAPDVDVRQIERLNGLAQVDKRNRLALDPQPILTGLERWVERGSSNQAGRMHVAVHSIDGQTLYAGSAKGGLWRRDLDAPWEPIGDNLYGGAHWLVTSAGGDDDDVLLAGTDNGMLHRSQDGGATWTVPAGLPQGMMRIRRLVKASDESGSIYGIFGTGQWEDRRYVVRYKAYRSDDGGGSFAEIFNMEAWAGDLWVPRDGGGGVYLLHESQVLRSDDQGEGWDVVGELPKGAWVSGELVGSEDGAPRLWSISTRNSKKWLLRSDDAGKTWTQLREAKDKWTGTMAASIVDQDVFAWGGVELWRTFDGGASFTRMNKWGAYYGDPESQLHADLPGLDVVPDADGEIWYISTDGGLYASSDSLRSVRSQSLDGLRVSQYYGTLTSSADTSHVAAGAQDQGYQTTVRVLNRNDDEIRPAVEQTQDILAFNQSISGDYAHLTSSGGTHEVVYSVYPGFIHVDYGGEDAYKFRRVNFPPGFGKHAWLPPVVADPQHANVVYLCGEKIWRYVRNDGGWEPEVWSEQSFRTQEGEYVSGLVFSPVDDDRAYLSTNRGGLYHSEDRGKTWTRGAGGAPSPQYFYGAAIAASPDDVDTVYVGGSGYGDNFAVVRSVDGGKTWSQWADGLPSTLVYTLTVTDDGRGEVFAGTETAAYRRLADATGWQDITSNAAPVTTYWSSELIAGEDTVRFGTYGRGIWDYRLDPEGTGCLDGVDADDDGVLCHLDCDDSDPTIYPGASEVCDGVDSNCDPTDLDEVDADDDGFWACEDCDDADSSVYPGAEEVRRDGIDQDCDGEDAKRCGCQSSTLMGSAWWLIFPLAGMALRRRQGGDMAQRD